jgi:hypothetical protein
MSIDEIIERLGRGETLMLNDQMRSYISMEDDDMPRRFVVRRVLQQRPGDAPPADWRNAPPQGRYKSLAEALLSLEDYEWIDK